ncbi:acyltransferase family protein [Mucilaginibacter glaciei]|uniref:Acyltransferase n=1 Tax=Mucilaginibacter glaciei TaxID=2772109 RepID=A0A926NH37_9SPHI|nr:acyltransferase [Mucilaginibacter glaciei]MBD1391964.1 acyltransferase [Mucilaginibacter glaciei]
MTVSGIKNRVDSLDYLRGLAAVGIMVYHMNLYTSGEPDSATLIAKVKIYGVIIFFILSGLTLYKVNVNHFVLSKSSLTQFYIKRFFRIVPLLYLATILTAIFYFQPEYLSVKKIIANVTVLPGAFKPETFIARGAWSIGDELFFYMLFPFLLWMARKHKALFLGLTALSFIIVIYFSFFKLSPQLTSGYQWAIYVSPLNHAFYFITGIALGLIEDRGKFRIWSVFAIIAVFMLVVFYPVSGEPAVLITGWIRLIISALVILLCYLFYKTDFDFLPGFIKKALHTLGMISYSLYLLHPVIYSMLLFFAGSLFGTNPLLLIMSTIVITLVVSYFTYHYFELYFIGTGKKFSSKYSNAKQSKLKNEAW